MSLSLLTFICGKQNRIRSLFPDDGVKFPISKGGAFVNKRVTAVNTLTERPAVVMVLFLFALTTAYLLSQVDVFDLEQPHRNVVVDGLCADRHLEQIHTLGTPADRIRRVFVFENGVFYIPDEVLCSIKFGRFSGVLTIALIAHLTGLCKILLIVRPIGTLLRYRAALYFLVQGGAGDAKVFGDFHLGDTETQHRFDLPALIGV